MKLNLLFAGILLSSSSCTLHNATFGAAATAISIDWYQTLEASHLRAIGSLEEQNPILGHKPSNGAVTLYFAAVLCALFVAQRLPERYSNVLNSSLAGLESVVILHNYTNPR